MGVGRLALGQNESVMAGAPLPLALSTDRRPFRPNRSCTYRGTSRPGGPRSARFTARTLSAFGTTSTSGTSFTLEEARRDGMRRRQGTETS